ncbi:MAG: hypothetical protein ABII00_05510 [Elusimicrobiota bacterium]
MQRLSARLFGIRVERALVLKLKEPGGLHHSDPSDNLFCIEMNGAGSSPQQALMRFKEIVEKSGLGTLFQTRERPWPPA